MWVITELRDKGRDLGHIFSLLLLCTDHKLDGISEIFKFIELLRVTLKFNFILFISLVGNSPLDFRRTNCFREHTESSTPNVLQQSFLRLIITNSLQNILLLLYHEALRMRSLFLFVYFTNNRKMNEKLIVRMVCFELVTWSKAVRKIWRRGAYFNSRWASKSLRKKVRMLRR